MKLIKYIIITVLITIQFVSCSSDFLDKEPSGMVSTSQLQEIAKRDPDKVLAPMLSGLYSTIFVSGTGGTTGHDDFGQKSIDIRTDLMCGDMAMNSVAYGWFVRDYDFTAQVRTETPAYMIWRYYYRLIRSANEILDILGGDDKMPETDVQKAYYGQAKAVRAYAYFYLVNLYQHPYSEAKDKPGVPVYRTQLSANPNGQSKVKDVYALIIKDLEDAVVALENFNRPSKTEINKYVAYGLLANAYLFTGEYKKAADAASMVINSNQFPLMSASDIVNSGFNSVTIPSWMWGVDITVENTGSLATFWGHVDYFTYSYAFAGNYKMIDASLYNNILQRPNDVRKNQFPLKPLRPLNKFFDAARVPGGDRAWTNDIVFMRIEEMILLKAEALARDGDNDGAKSALEPLLALRDVDGAARIASMNNEQLLDEIYYNWRAEMWGEGKSYLAMKRYKKTITRGDNHIKFPGESFAYNYKWMIYEIPEREWINNPHLVPQDGSGN